ncbi:hypothetical protein TPHA_0L02180 [Tetrapisispora phaffii CBS 4417]|uniref:Protein kinase domain-containing protein n=1 Tax=Tetrapisispora phaffii (strain ATCC 24235 / CBS 4417 / NBRC 1672 / NRRL Y-8282 / UCD 70-5) TaxID=1071381 RepID=G8C091_TETPH|nr:hypothetical protein TPHA_0L02180 [Tetrapisispora phaffii CBS 4417]CCE65569.1 hypothetical protein TPHA_0L02180 [Tetrapisispora phaffii CBS 4417]
MSASVKRTISDIHLFWPQYNQGLKYSDGDSDSSNKKRNALKCKYILDVGLDQNSDELGDGHFSKVKRCQNVITHKYYAMKLIDKNLIKNEKLKLVSREINLLKLISEKIRSLEDSTDAAFYNGSENQGSWNAAFIGHHHVLQLMDYFETKDNIALVTQLCDNNDLYETIIDNEYLPDTSVKAYTACLLSCLSFLHSNDVIHRDLKAENVFFRLHNHSSELPRTAVPSAHDIILGDFGLATTTNHNWITSKNSLKEYVGTVSYISPEIVRCRNVKTMDQNELQNLPDYGTPVDIWSLGVLVYFMKFGYMPFDCDDDEETLDCIKVADYFIDQESYDDKSLQSFWSFLKLCFTIDQNKRPTASALQSHLFVAEFTNINNNVEPLRETASDIEKSDWDNHVPFEDFRTHLRSRPSSTSLHSLKSPKKSISSSSLNSFNYDPVPVSATTFTSPPNTASLNSSNNKKAIISKKTVNIMSTNSVSTSLTIPNVSDIQLPTRSPMAQFHKRRESLKKTLSMTSIKKPSMASLNTAPKLVKNHIDSTFILDPKPPKNALMNGSYSLMPETKSNEIYENNEQMEIPRLLSRPSSATDIGHLVLDDRTNVTNKNDYIQHSNVDINTVLKNSLSQNGISQKVECLFPQFANTHSAKPKFSLGDDDDDDDEE